MPAGTYTIVAEQGARLFRRFRYETETDGVYAPVDLTGYTARMSVRQHLWVTEPLIALTSDVDGGITLGGVAGTVEIDIPATTMANAPAVKAQYDIELVPPSGEANAIRFLEGAFIIKAEVTR